MLLRECLLSIHETLALSTRCVVQTPSNLSTTEMKAGGEKFKVSRLQSEFQANMGYLGHFKKWENGKQDKCFYKK